MVSLLIHRIADGVPRLELNATRKRKVGLTGDSKGKRATAKAGEEVAGLASQNASLPPTVATRRCACRLSTPRATRETSRWLLMVPHVHVLSRPLMRQDLSDQLHHARRDRGRVLVTGAELVEECEAGERLDGTHHGFVVGAHDP